MAHYDITPTATQIVALGGAEKLAALGLKIDRWGDCTASNARQFDAAKALLASLQAPAATTITSTTNEHIEAAYRAGARHGVNGQIWDNA